MIWFLFIVVFPVVTETADLRFRAQLSFFFSGSFLCWGKEFWHHLG
jgi:hypothetical protein